MTLYTKTVAGGAVALVLFDLVAAIGSMEFHFPYTRASFGSLLICMLIGFLVGSNLASRRPMKVITAGVVLGLADATLGWVVAYALGVYKAHHHLRLMSWLIVCLVVMATYSLFTAIGCGIAVLLSGNKDRGIPR